MSLYFVFFTTIMVLSNIFLVVVLIKEYALYFNFGIDQLIHMCYYFHPCLMRSPYARLSKLIITVRLYKKLKEQNPFLIVEDVYDNITRLQITMNIVVLHRKRMTSSDFDIMYNNLYNEIKTFSRLDDSLL